MVDEAQDVRPSSREAGIVRMLHQGHVSEIPVLPVLAGLGHLREHLGQPGIRLSRLSDERRSAHTLGALSDGEVRELFAGWLDRFGVAAGGGRCRALVRRAGPGQSGMADAHEPLPDLAGEGAPDAGT